MAEVMNLKKRKSKFDLSEVAILKVPKSQYAQLKKLTDNTNIHWSECARMVLDWWLRQPSDSIPKKKVAE